MGRMRASGRVPTPLRSKWIGRATCRDDCRGGLIALGARELPHETNVIALAGLVQQGVAIDHKPVSGRTDVLDGKGRARIADCGQLALSLLFHVGLRDDRSGERKNRSSNNNARQNVQWRASRLPAGALVR